MDKILILGGSSFVGKHLFNFLGTDKAIATYNKNPIKDGIHFDSVSMDARDLLKDNGPIAKAVILLGDTNPETCFKDEKISRELNVESIKRIIDVFVEEKIKFLFTSSEFVFDGKKGNYIEDDEVSPVLIYGKQKIEVEKYIKDNCDDYIVGRLAKVYGSTICDGTLFTNWLSAISSGKDIDCATDQIFSPVYIGDVVASIVELLKVDAKGIFHICGNKAYSRFELFNILASYMEKHVPVKNKINKCSIHDFPLCEKRPLNVSMKPDKLIKTTGIKIHSVHEICEKIVADYYKGGMNG